MCPTPGLYYIKGELRWSDSKTGYRTLYLNHNDGSSYSIQYSLKSYPNSNSISSTETGECVQSVVATFNATESKKYIDLWAQQNSGSTLNVVLVSIYVVKLK